MMPSAARSSCSCSAAAPSTPPSSRSMTSTPSPGVLPRDRRRGRTFAVIPGGARVSSPDPRCIRGRVGLHIRCRRVPRGAIITELNSKTIDTLADFTAAISELGDGARVTVRYVTIDDPNGSQLRSIRIDRRWFPARQCQRDDHAGYWPCTELPSNAKVELPAPASAQLQRIDDHDAAAIAPSLAFITFDMPYAVSVSPSATTTAPD